MDGENKLFPFCGLIKNDKNRYEPIGRIKLQMSCILYYSSNKKKEQHRRKERKLSLYTFRGTKKEKECKGGFK